MFYKGFGRIKFLEIISESILSPISSINHRVLVGKYFSSSRQKNILNITSKERAIFVASSVKFLLVNKILVKVSRASGIEATVHTA